MLTNYLIITLVVGFVVAITLMLIRVVFYNQIKRVANEKNAEILNWLLYQERWDGDRNTQLYAWRCLIYDLKNQCAPREQIEAAERQYRACEKRLTKGTWMVTPSGKVKEKLTVGGA